MSKTPVQDEAVARPEGPPDPRPAPDVASTSRLRAAAPSIGAGLLVLAPLILIAACFWPGHMSADTLSGIQQADTGAFTNQHAPLLYAIWHPFYDLGLGPGWALMAQLLAFGGATFLLLRSALTPLAAALATALIAMSPVVFGMLGYLSRDVWFTGLLLLTFAFSLRAVQSQRHRSWWTAAALVAAWLTLASRQNAATAVFLALTVLAFAFLGARVQGKVRRWGAALGAGILMTLVLMGTQLPANAIIGTQDVDPEQYLYIYDVAAMSHQNRENLFPRSVMRARGMRPIDAFWNVDSVNPYLFLDNSPIKTPLAPKAVEELRGAWTDAITSDPLGYLQARWEQYKRQIALTRRANWVYHPVIDPNEEGFRVRFPEADAQARDYVEGFADDQLNGGVLYTLWVYLLLGAISGVYLLRTGRLELMTVGALGVASLTLQIGLFVATMGTQYRFEFPTVVIGLICTITAVAVWRQGRRSGRMEDLGA